MTYRILAPIKSFALSAALRIAAGRSRILEAAAPEPRVRSFEPEHVSDEWMFDSQVTPVSAEAYVFSREMSRVSGALSGLRSLLTQISAHAPVLDRMPEGVPFGALIGDSILFDGEPMAASYGPAPVEDADLFEDQSAFLPALVRRGSEDVSRVA
jgi:hypothetical protein